MTPPVKRGISPIGGSGGENRVSGKRQGGKASRCKELPAIHKDS